MGRVPNMSVPSQFARVASAFSAGAVGSEGLAGVIEAIREAEMEAISATSEVVFTALVFAMSVVYRGGHEFSHNFLIFFGKNLSYFGAEKGGREHPVQGGFPPVGAASRREDFDAAPSF